MIVNLDCSKVHNIIMKSSSENSNSNTYFIITDRTVGVTVGTIELSTSSGGQEESSYEWLVFYQVRMLVVFIHFVFLRFWYFARYAIIIFFLIRLKI